MRGRESQQRYNIKLLCYFFVFGGLERYSYTVLWCLNVPTSQACTSPASWANFPILKHLWCKSECHSMLLMMVSDYGEKRARRLDWDFAREPQSQPCWVNVWPKADGEEELEVSCGPPVFVLKEPRKNKGCESWQSGHIPLRRPGAGSGATFKWL